MRSVISIFLLLCSALLQAQHLTYDEWRLQALKDLRLRPRYGSAQLNPAQRESNAEFVRLTLAADSIPRSASSKLVSHGFDLLRQGDHTKALFRFNQAYLVDSTNADAYWGFGSVFLEMGHPVQAHTMFRAGLSVDSASTHLLNGEATAYLAERAALAGSDSVAERALVDKALAMTERAVRHDPMNADALQRKASCHLLRDECAQAWSCHEQALRLSPAPAEPGFEKLLRSRCPQ